MFRSHPWLAALFAIPAAFAGRRAAALRLLGQAAGGAEWTGGDYLWGGAALLVGGLTLYSMLKLWIEAFWKPRPEGSPEPSAAIPARAWLACGGLAAITPRDRCNPSPARLLDGGGVRHAVCRGSR